MGRKLPKRVHVIGICGVATSALAIAFHKRGVSVTGSDKGFFPPVSTELDEQGVTYYAGWHPEKMIEGGVPDVIIVGTASGSHNPETLYAKEHGIPMLSFAQAIGEYVAQSTSIVCSGTWGKTSSTALLSYIFEYAGKNPSYMFGGISLAHESSAKLTDSDISIFEGDEYKSSPTDTTAKFFYYKPTHLLLSAVSWDHADLYPTEESYFNVFKKLLAGMPVNGFIVACADHDGVDKILGSYTGKVIRYGRAHPGAPRDYEYTNASQTKDGLRLTVHAGGETYDIRSPMLGLYQIENICGCFAMAHQFGIAPQTIIEAVGRFTGLKRRMEKRLDGDVTVIDDIAHSGEKAASALATLRAIYDGRIICVFEPNIGGRRREALAKYDRAFTSADEVVIPRLTKLKIAEHSDEQPIEGDELVRTIGKTQPHVTYIDDDAKLVSYLKTTAKKGDVIAFLGSHGFRGMIEEVTSPRPQSQS